MESQTISCLLLFLLWMVLNAPICSENVLEQTCDHGWFGSNCQYKCRSRGRTCDQDGVCSDGVCEMGWFGPACQFVDLVYTNSARTKAWWILDSDATTCNKDQSLKHLTVQFVSEITFSWLRLQVSDPSLLHEFQVTFKRDHNTVKCINMRHATVNETTLDIHCDVDVLVQDVILNGEGVKSLCSLYVSGGRNVALRQNTSQTSTYSNNRAGHYRNLSVAGNAVDGNTDSEWINGSCTSTDGDRNPTWSVTLSSSHLINRYVVYNRNSNQERLIGFTLTSFTKDLKMVFNNTDTERSHLSVYTMMNVLGTATVSAVNISANPYVAYPVLSLCEVELYGDSACPPSRYGRECEHTCNCAVKDESCFVSTGGCPSGCAAGFQSEDCDRVCDFGKYGLDCSYNCSQFCVETNSSRSPCRHTDGACVLGCVNGYQTPKCDNISLVVMGDNAIRVAAVVGPVVVVIILVVVSLLGVFLWRRSRTNVYNQSSTKVSDDGNEDSVHYEEINHTDLSPTNLNKRSKPTALDSQLTVPKQTAHNSTTKINYNDTVYYNTVSGMS